jgi:hypothetical protein
MRLNSQRWQPRRVWRPSSLPIEDRGFTSYVQRAVGDEILAPEEEDHVQELMRILGIDLGAFLRQDPELGRHVMVAEANGGFLPDVPASRLVQKKGEIVHLEVPATLLKDVTVRQSQGGYSGFSFPIGETGIRYRVGGYHGHSVEVGTKRVPADDGFLVLSSQRAVFIGNKKTIELPYTKLVNLRIFSDGVQFHTSNRQTAPRVRRSGVRRRRRLRPRGRSTPQRRCLNPSRPEVHNRAPSCRRSHANVAG